MKEFHVTMRIRNNLIRKRREQMGLSAKQLAEAAGIPYTALLQLEGIRLYPVTQKGEWRLNVVRLATFFKCLPEDLFPDAIKAVQKPEVTAELESEKMLAFAKMAAVPELPPTPEDEALSSNVSLELHRALEQLTPKEQEVLRMRFGEELSLDEVGDRFGLSVERIRQIEKKSFRKLRHPSRSGALQQLLFEGDDLRTIELAPDLDVYQEDTEATIVLGGDSCASATLVPLYRVHDGWCLGMETKSEHFVGFVFRHRGCSCQQRCYLPIHPYPGWVLVNETPITIFPGFRCKCGISGQVLDGEFVPVTH